MSNVIRGGGWPGILAVGALLVACNVYDEELLKGSATPPARPDPSTEGPDIEPLTFAIRRPVLEQTVDDAWKTIGFDLDGFDTTSPDSDEVECLPPGRTAQIDGDRGIDNNLGAKFYPQIRFTQELMNLEQEARDAHEAGRGTFVFYVSGYNGTRNDPNMDVVIGQAVGGTSAPYGDVTYVNDELVLPDGGLAPPPAWDGSDQWFLSDATFLLGQFAQPQLVDLNAYVSNGIMVVHLPSGSPFYFGTESRTVHVILNGGYAVGPIAEDLSAVGPITIAGRWRSMDIVATAGPAGICTEQLVLLLQAALNSQVDVMATPPPTAGPDLECDALSIGVIFEDGIRAIPEAPQVVDAPPPPDFCATIDGGVP